MAKKGTMPNYKTVDDYISVQPKEAQPVLQELRKIIKEAAPEAVEIPDYKVPSFKLVATAKTEQQLMIMAFTKYISFYPFQATIDQFANELKGFELGKGTVKFPLDKPLPKNLIKRMVLFRKEEIIKSNKNIL